MKIAPTKISGAFTVDIQPHDDERGFFARTWCAHDFAAAGLDPRATQTSISYNRHKGTLRGLHFQRAPKEEPKLVRCTRGAIYDVVVDLRPQSPTFRDWVAFDLTADNHRALFVPAGCAHGFQTLVDDVEVLYQMGERYSADHAAGVRWNDPAFGVRWPLPPGPMSERDRTYPDFRP